ncbi:hypothetical protein [uncultured Clostridium sp.]|uniref:hypothetical protein n=1 Tax=uncultured Clostridium sp. TaxID=59620 RepID=UPI0032173C86
MINIKKKINIICVLGVFSGIFMNRFLTTRYGNSGSIILASVALTLVVISMIIIIIMKKFLEALILLPIVLPGIIMFIGIFIDNLYVGGVGLISLMIAIPIMIKITPKLKDKYRS